MVSAGFLQNRITGFAEHHHNIWEITYYTEGEGINRVGDVDIPFSKGTIICQPPFIRHCEISNTGYKNMHFTVNFMDDFQMDVPVFKDGYKGEFKQLTSQLISCYLKMDRNWENISNALLNTMTEYMFSWSDNDSKNKYVEMCQNVIVENLSNARFSLSDFLGDIPVSKSHFIKLFKKQTGQTPLEMLKSRRIAHAKRLLNSKQSLDLTVNDIARLCGFDDQFYFSRVFRQKVGVSPLKYHSELKSQ